MFDDGADGCYIVVLNHEEHHSIWPENMPLPMGWVATGVAGRQAECLEHISEVWTDLRPKSLRELSAGNQ